MPATYEIDPAAAVAWCRCSGRYTFAEVLSALRRALDDPEARQGVNLILDLQASQSSRSGSELRDLVSELRRAERFAGCCAVLVDPQATLRFGLARMLMTYAEAEGMQFNVFTSADKAMRWLSENPTPT